MQEKILQVFYGNDCLPYKDKERSVHFPIIGAAIQGASNTTKIRFYFDELVSEDDETTTWVVVSKLPNGKIGSEIVETTLDEELNEHYALFTLKNFYTQAKGDLYLSLQGYQGGVQVETDPDTGISQIVGTPTIQATGSIKLAINYATQLVGSGETANINFQKILADLGTKLGIRAYTEKVTELPTIGQTNVFYAIYDDANDPNKLNIYVWNATTQSYVWVGDNSLYLGDYYTKEEGNEFENDVDNSIQNIISMVQGLGQLQPSGVDTSTNILGFTENKGIWVGSDTGKWYYWNGTQYVVGGNYVSSPFVQDMPSNTNIDTFTDNGIFLASSGDITGGTLPSGVDACYILNAYTSIYKHYQICISNVESIGSGTVGKMFIRNRVNTWRAWREIPYSSDLANYFTKTEINTMLASYLKVQDITANTNLDNLTTNGAFLCANDGITNLPTGVSVALVINCYTSIYRQYQLCIDAQTEDVYVRTRINTWKSWRKITNDDIPNKIIVQYTEEDGVDSSTEKFDVYYPFRNKYIHYIIVHTVNEDENADVWRVAYAYLADKDLTNIKQLTTTGEWEMALKMLGKDDFMGGYMHGDEIQYGINFFANGVEVGKTAFSTARELESFAFVQQSNLYDANDHTTNVAKHYSVHEFSLNNEHQLIIKQRVHWTMPLTMTIGYMAMFPIAKDCSIKCYLDLTYSLINTPTYIPKTNGVSEIKLCSSNLAPSGYYAVEGTFGISKYPEYNSGGFLLTDNGGTAYNKCYFAIAENQMTSTDDDFVSETYYDFSLFD